MPDAAAGGRAPDAAAELALLRERQGRTAHYIRDKVNELLQVIGTAPLRPEELDDETLISLDPIGIVAGSFRQVLRNLRQTNDRLRAAREELQAIFDCAGMGIMVIDRDQRIVACNRKFREQFRLGDGDLTGRSCRELVCRADRPERPCPFRVTLETGAPYRCPDWLVGGRHYDIVETAVHDPSGGIAGSVLVYADVTERIATEEALRASEERYRDLFENANDLIMSARLDGTLEYVNAAWCATLGYGREEIARLSITDLLHPDCDGGCRDRIADLLRGKSGGRVHTVLCAKDGRRVVLEGDVGLVRQHGRPVGIRGILRDVTDRERLEEELRRREKLESVGLLAGGIAHDFNNILTAILGNISLALAAPPGAPVRARLEEAERAALSARALTQQLLTFAHGGEPVKKLAALEPLLREQATFACRGSGATCIVEIEAGLRAAEVDEGQIGQVVHNLVLNAVQAMPGGGVVRVQATNVADGAAEDPVLAPGAHVRIAVQDTGVGIPAENLARMFDPYFTTKAGGTGLGLAVTHSIVKRHGGHMRVSSEPGRGSTFVVYLPARGDAAGPAEAAPPPAPQPGQGRVLVMDDEQFVRDTAGEMLRSLGYDVETVADGAAAIAAWEQARRAGRPFDVAVMDLTVPGAMGGKEAVRELRRLDPEARAIVSSGYSSDPVMSRFEEHGFVGVIAKPYRLSDLAGALRAAARRG